MWTPKFVENHNYSKIHLGISKWHIDFQIVQKNSMWAIMWWACIMKINLMAKSYGHLKNHDGSWKFNLEYSIETSLGDQMIVDWKV
jgi:hypothetical protein